MGLLSAEDPADTPVAWAFVVVQFALLAAILVLPAGDAWVLAGWAETVARVLQLAGLAFLVAGLVGLGASLTPLPSPSPHSTLRTGGVYRLVRHPIYTGTLGLAAGLAMRSGSWAVVAASVALAALFSAKARWEEARLARRYPDYAAYARRVPRFVPGWPRR